jgi:molecular chaperone GrpE (heat shock protein)
MSEQQEEKPDLALPEQLQAATAGEATAAVAAEPAPENDVAVVAAVKTEADAKLGMEVETPATPDTASLEDHRPATSENASGEIRDELRRLFALCSSFEARLENLETAMDTTAKQVAFLPPQVRQLSSKIEGLNTSISEPRYRGVLLNLLGVYDLADQVLRSLPPANADEDEAITNHRRDYEVFRTQLRQILESNGLTEIPAHGEFNPAAHRAVKRMPVVDRTLADQVLEVVRPGFRTEQAVLRFAEVVVGHYLSTENSEEDKPGGDESALQN